MTELRELDPAELILRRNLFPIDNKYFYRISASTDIERERIKIKELIEIGEVAERKVEEVDSFLSRKGVDRSQSIYCGPVAIGSIFGVQYIPDNIESLTSRGGGVIFLSIIQKALDENEHIRGIRSPGQKGLIQYLRSDQFIGGFVIEKTSTSSLHFRLLLPGLGRFTDNPNLTAADLLDTEVHQDPKNFGEPSLISVNTLFERLASVQEFNGSTPIEIFMRD